LLGFGILGMAPRDEEEVSYGNECHEEGKKYSKGPWTDPETWELVATTVMENNLGAYQEARWEAILEKWAKVSGILHPEQPTCLDDLDLAAAPVVPPTPANDKKDTERIKPKKDKERIKPTHVTTGTKRIKLGEVTTGSVAKNDDPPVQRSHYPLFELPAEEPVGPVANGNPHRDVIDQEEKKPPQKRFKKGDHVIYKNPRSKQERSAIVTYVSDDSDALHTIQFTKTNETWTTGLKCLRQEWIDISDDSDE
jgi:hypothetical protein